MILQIESRLTDFFRKQEMLSVTNFRYEHQRALSKYLFRNASLNRPRFLNQCCQLAYQILCKPTAI